MSTFLDVDLTTVDTSFKLVPVGVYNALITEFELRTNEDGTLKDVKFTYVLRQGPTDGIGMEMVEFINPANEFGIKKLKLLALATNVPFDAQHIDLDAFVNTSVNITVIHKADKKDATTMYANIKKYDPAVDAADL